MAIKGKKSFLNSQVSQVKGIIHTMTPNIRCIPRRTGGERGYAAFQKLRAIYSWLF
jgi:hypothetical protein